MPLANVGSKPSCRHDINGEQSGRYSRRFAEPAPAEHDRDDGRHRHDHRAERSLGCAGHGRAAGHRAGYRRGTAVKKPSPPQLAVATTASDEKPPSEQPADGQASDNPPADGQLADSQLVESEQGSLNSPPPPVDAAIAAEHHDDRDPAEENEFRRQAEAIVDWGLAIQGIENPAYWRIARMDQWSNRSRS